MAEWLSVNPDSGTGSGTTTVVVSAHTGRSDRLKNVRVTAGALSQIVEVTQVGAAVALTISSNTFSGSNISATSSTYTITGKSNTPDLKLIVSSGTAAIISGVKLTKLNGVTKNIALTSTGGTTPTFSVAVPDDPGTTAKFTFTLTVTTSANEAYTTRQVKYRIGGTGASNSSLYTATQRAAAEELTVTPAAMVFLADGTIDSTIEGNTATVTVTTTNQSATWTVTLEDVSD